MEPAQNIEEVIHHLDQVVARARAEGSRLGYFAALYRKVTAVVQEGIAAGRFDDGPRLERLDVLFANRYLDALAKYRAGGGATRSWRLAFQAAERWPPLVMQHLLLGTNAHINLDLGIAAAEAAPGAALPALRADFERINEILASLVDESKAALAGVWPPLLLLDGLAGRTEDLVITFSMKRARDQAWAVAERLNGLSTTEKVAAIARLDRDVARLAERLLRPSLPTRLVLWRIRLAERGSVADIIDRLL